MGGSCLRFSYQALKKFKKTFPQATTVFQLTLPYRITVGHSDIEINYDLLSKPFDDNYWHLRVSHKLPFYTLNPGTVAGDWPQIKTPKELKQFYLDYFKYFPDQYELTALEFLIEKIYQQSDFTYYQFPDKDLVSVCKNYNIPTIPIKSNEYKSYQIDQYGHLNQQGNQIIADWISNQLNL